MFIIIFINFLSIYKIKIGTHLYKQNMLSIFIKAEFLINQKSSSIKIDKYKTYLNKHY